LDSNQLWERILLVTWSWLKAYQKIFSWSYQQWQANLGLCLQWYILGQHFWFHDKMDINVDWRCNVLYLSICRYICDVYRERCNHYCYWMLQFSLLCRLLESSFFRRMHVISGTCSWFWVIIRYIFYSCVAHLVQLNELILLLIKKILLSVKKFTFGTSVKNFI